MQNRPVPSSRETPEFDQLARESAAFVKSGSRPSARVRKREPVPPGAQEKPSHSGVREEQDAIEPGAAITSPGATTASSATRADGGNLVNHTPGDTATGFMNESGLRHHEHVPCPAPLAASGLSDGRGPPTVQDIILKDVKGAGEPRRSIGNPQKRETRPSVSAGRQEHTGRIPKSGFPVPRKVDVSRQRDLGDKVGLPRASQVRPRSSKAKTGTVTDDMDPPYPKSRDILWIKTSGELAINHGDLTFDDVLRGADSPSYLERRHSTEILRKLIGSRQLVYLKSPEWLMEAVEATSLRCDDFGTTFLRAVFPPDFSVSYAWTSAFWPPDILQLQASMAWSLSHLVKALPFDRDRSGRTLLTDKRSVKPVKDFEQRKNVAKIVAAHWKVLDENVWEGVFAVPASFGIGETARQSGIWNLLCKTKQQRFLKAILLGLGLHGLPAGASLDAFWLCDAVGRGSEDSLSCLAVLAAQAATLPSWLTAESLAELVDLVPDDGRVVAECLLNRLAEAYFVRGNPSLESGPVVRRILSRTQQLLLKSTSPVTGSEEIAHCYLTASVMNLLIAVVPYHKPFEADASLIALSAHANVRSVFRTHAKLKEPGVSKAVLEASKSMLGFTQSNVDRDRYLWVNRTWAVAFLARTVLEFNKTFRHLLPSPTVIHNAEIPDHLTEWLPHIASIVT